MKFVGAALPRKNSRATRVFMVLLATVLAPAAWYAAHFISLPNDSAGTAANTMFPLWGPAALLLGLLALAGRVRRALWILIPAGVLAPFELFYLVQYNLPSGPHLYGVIADTDSNEALTWLGIWLWPTLAFTLGWVLSVGWAARMCWLANWRWHHRSRWWVLAAMAVLLGSLVAKELSLASITKPRDANQYLQYSLDLPDDGLATQLEATFPWGLPQRFWHFAEHQRALNSHLESTVHHDFGVHWHAGLPGEGRQIMVFVIGETGRPDRWGLFGAERDTTPQLSARHDLLLFNDAVSGASATREAVPLMLTRRPPASMLAPTGEPSVVTAFRQAGFKTYWLSTQGAAGAHETPVSVLARESNEQHFVNAADYRGAGALDGVLLPLLQQVLARPEQRQMIVLHTLGSHMNYAHRYSPSFERFRPAMQPSDKADIWQAKQATEMRNAYDNSVLYTDHVLSKAIQLIEETGASATLLYAADHGEALFDGSCGRAGHGFAAEVAYRVPVFVWTSQKWRKERPTVLQNLRARQHEPVSTLAIFPTLTGLAGFEVAAPSAHADLSVAQRPYAARLVTHFGDFDRQLVGKSCDSQSPAAIGVPRVGTNGVSAN